MLAVSFGGQEMHVPVDTVIRAGLAWVYEDDSGLNFAAIAAQGQTQTGGWSDARLVIHAVTDIPADGMIDIDVVALPPSPHSVVEQVLTDLHAVTLLALPSWVRGARVISQAGPVQARVVGAPGPGPYRPLDGLPVPWPFPWWHKPGLHTESRSGVSGGHIHVYGGTGVGLANQSSATVSIKGRVDASDFIIATARQTYEKLSATLGPLFLAIWDNGNPSAPGKPVPTPNEFVIRVLAASGQAWTGTVWVDYVIVRQSP